MFLFKNVHDVILKKYHEQKRKNSEKIGSIEIAFHALCDSRFPKDFEKFFETEVEVVKKDKVKNVEEAVLKKSKRQKK